MLNAQSRGASKHIRHAAALAQQYSTCDLDAAQSTRWMCTIARNCKKVRQSSRVLDVQYGLVRKVHMEGHCWGSCNDICTVLLFQPLMEHLHVQQPQEAASAEWQ